MTQPVQCGSCKFWKQYRMGNAIIGGPDGGKCEHPEMENYVFNLGSSDDLWTSHHFGCQLGESVNPPSSSDQRTGEQLER